MRYKYLFNPAALDEYVSAIEWYEEQSTIAADNLIGEVRARLALICTDPYRYRCNLQAFRETSLKKVSFLYRLFY